MNTRDLLRLVWSNLKRMRGRAIMTSLGVLVGTAAIVVLISLASGLQESVTGDLSQFGPLNQITVFPGSFLEALGGAGTGRGDEQGLLTPRALENFSRLEGVTTATPVDRYYGQMTIKLNRLVGSERQLSLTGIDPRAVRSMDMELAEGSDALGRWTIIVGSRVAESFYNPRRANISQDDDPPDLFGQTLTVELTRFDDEGKPVARTVRLRVGGVLDERGGQDDYSIFLDIHDIETLNAWYTGRRVDRRTEGYSQALIIVDDPQRLLQIERQLLLDGYFAYSARSTLQQVNIIFAVIQAVFGGIGAIALVVAAIGIANTMIMSILERTREIGLMKAVGATNRHVMSVFVAEAGAIGMLGGIGGVLFGVGVAKVISLIARAYIEAEIATAGGSGGGAINIAVIPLWLPIFAILFSLAVGLAAGIYPAMRAVQLDPVTALKYE